MVSSVTAIRATTAQAVYDHPEILRQQITSGQLWEIAPDSVGGLLLIRPFYVDFAGLGAAVGGTIDDACTQVIPLGRVRLRPLQTLRDRQEALEIRATYAEQLADIITRPTATERAQALIQQLHQWLPGNLALVISATQAAGLVGVLPTTVTQAWSCPLDTAMAAPKAIAPDGRGSSRVCR